MFLITVTAARHAETSAEHIEPGDAWVVEGDYGFMGSFKTQGEAWQAAQAEAAAINASSGAGTVDLQLNA